MVALASYRTKGGGFLDEERCTIQSPLCSQALLRMHDERASSLCPLMAATEIRVGSPSEGVSAGRASALNEQCQCQSITSE